MSKEQSSKKSESNECPNCEFAGKDSNPEKFSEEKRKQFPKGFAPENHPKIILVTKGGIEVQEFATDKETHEIILNQTKRCPVCGHTGDAKQ